MAKIRIQDLANKYGLNPMETLKRLQRAGFKVHTKLATVDEDKAMAHVAPRPEAVEDDIVRIKKYENRRLYSNTESRHLTMEEVRDLIRSGRAIEVTDAVTGKDITSEVLTQILLEQGRARELPAAFLLHVIRLQDEAVSSFFERTLGTGLQMYVQAQKEMVRLYETFSPAKILSSLPWLPGADERTDAAHWQNELQEKDAEIARLRAKIEALNAALEEKNAPISDAVTRRISRRKKRIE